jgi:hypothetical protein
MRYVVRAKRIRCPRGSDAGKNFTLKEHLRIIFETGSTNDK